MTEPVMLFPDAVKLFVGVVGDGFGLSSEPDVVIDNAVPNPRPLEFMVIRRQGGPRRNLVVDQAQLRFEQYAQTAERAAALALLGRAYVQAARGQVRDGFTICRIEEFAGPQDLPDPITQLPRYVFTELVHLRGIAVT